MTQTVNAPIDHNLILLNCHKFVQNAKLTTKIQKIQLLLLLLLLLYNKRCHCWTRRWVNAQLKVKPTTEASIVSQLRHSAFLTNNFFRYNFLLKAKPSFLSVQIHHDTFVQCLEIAVHEAIHLEPQCIYNLPVYLLSFGFTSSSFLSETLWQTFPFHDKFSFLLLNCKL